MVKNRLSTIFGFAGKIENSLTVLAVTLMALIPAAEVVARKFFKTGFPHSTEYTHHLVLILTFAAAMITSREGKHLCLSLALNIHEPLKSRIHAGNMMLSVTMVTAFAWSTLSFILSGFGPSQMVGIFPIRLVALVMVVGFVIMAARFILQEPPKEGLTPEERSLVEPALEKFFRGKHSKEERSMMEISLVKFARLKLSPEEFAPVKTILEGLHVVGPVSEEPIPAEYSLEHLVMKTPHPDAPPKRGLRLFAAFGILLGSLLAIEPIYNAFSFGLGELPGFMETLLEFGQSFNSWVAVPMIILLVVGTIFGVPLFVVLGGVAYLLFARVGNPLEVIPNESYSMLISHSIPAIPLFTITGFLLSESKAGQRLVEFFKAFFGWFRGGLAIMAVLVCSFFTTFTGASGVTILALGALLSYVLVNGKYDKKFSIGLLTASGSVGLLFPPSLPIIIYGVIAGISIKSMFIGGIIPGIVMVLALVIYSVFYAKKNKTEPIPFKPKEAVKSLYKSLGEIMLPVVILLFYFGGITTLVESSAISVIYVLIVEVFIHKDLKIRDLPGVVMKCAPIIGGVLIILSMAKGLSYFIVDAEIPVQLTEWVQTAISSKYVFLLLLNVLLLITGCFMDIFSAIMVVVPLILPLGQLFGIHPVHMGIIFLANMELGYMTPPVGLNLFLASYRFNEPMGKLYKDVMPFFLIQLIAVLLITYLPFLSTGLLAWFN